MKTTLSGALAAALLLGLWASPNFPSETQPVVQSESALKAKVDELANRLLAQGEGVGIVVGVIDKGKLRVFTYGQVEENSGIKPDARTEFEIGSVTKTFTATLLALYVKRGLVRYDDPLQKFVPEGICVPTFDGKQITLLHLATHTSGLPNSPILRGHEHYTVRQMLGYLNLYQLRRAPGARYEYSNLGFGLLAYALEQVGQDVWEHLVVREICSPLRMADTRIHLRPAQLDRLAQGYNANGDPAPYDLRSWPAFNGAGALRSTLDDLLKYLQFNMGLVKTDLNVLLDDLHKEWHEGARPGTGVGLAWQMFPIKGSNRKYIVKNGQTAGFHCWIGFVEESKTGVVVIVNQAAREVFDKLGHDILIFLNRDAIRPEGGPPDNE
jgi:CubicO group peptidase (beta-lactamase class C family)